MPSSIREAGLLRRSSESGREPVALATAIRRLATAGADASRPSYFHRITADAALYAGQPPQVLGVALAAKHGLAMVADVLDPRRPNALSRAVGKQMPKWTAGAAKLAEPLLEQIPPALGVSFSAGLSMGMPGVASVGSSLSLRANGSALQKEKARDKLELSLSPVGASSLIGFARVGAASGTAPNTGHLGWSGGFSAGWVGASDDKLLGVRSLSVSIPQLFSLAVGDNGSIGASIGVPLHAFHGLGGGVGLSVEHPAAMKITQPVFALYDRAASFARTHAVKSK